jgi:hypothetical protein
MIRVKGSVGTESNTVVREKARDGQRRFQRVLRD